MINQLRGDGMKKFTLVCFFLLIIPIIILPEEFHFSLGDAAGDDVDPMAVNVTTAKHMVDSISYLVILDVQETPDYLAGHLRNALSIPLSELEERLGDLNPNRETLIYGKTGYGSSEARTILLDNGFINLYDMCCGIRGWSDAGYPVYKKYPSVRSAVLSVPEGDSVFLSSGVYVGDFTINKTISLLGENQTSTIIEGSGSGVSINVTSDRTLVSSLTVRNGEIGILSFATSGTEISNCTFSGLETAVSLLSSRSIKLRDNTMSDCSLYMEGKSLEHWDTHSIDGTNLVNGKPLYYATKLSNTEVLVDASLIILVNCTNVTVSGRDFNSNSIGITLAYSSYSHIRNNTFYSNGISGISIHESHDNMIIDNTFESNGDAGINLADSSLNTLNRNLIKDNGGYGVSLLRGTDNRVFNNTFIRNNGGMVQAEDRSDNCSWDDGSLGNYWSDYKMKYPGAANDSRVWDTPYLIRGTPEISDRYPAVTPTVALSSYPVSDAGPDINVIQHTLVRFDGSYSFDKGQITNYTWTFQYDGKPVILNGIISSFIFHLAGIYTVTLNVTNSLGLSDHDVIILTVNDIEPPTADAGEDRTIDQFTLVFFLGKNCSDNILVVNYTWSFKYGMDTIVLHGYNASFRFQAAGRYNVTLKIFDASANWNIDQIEVLVRDITPPVASAGDDQNLPQGSPFMFNAVESHDDSGILNYSWSFRDDDSEILLFGIQSSYTFNQPGEYLVILNVTDVAGLTGTDIINISVIDIYPPEAIAGPDINIRQHDSVVFNGSGSSDNQGISNFSWSFAHGGRNITLFGGSVSYTFDHPGNYTVVMKVKDDQGLQDVDFLYVNVERINENGSDNGWFYGVLGIIILFSALMVLILTVRRGKSSNSMGDKNGEQESEEMSINGK